MDVSQLPPMSGEEADSEGSGTDVEDPAWEDLEGEDLQEEGEEREGEDLEGEDLEVQGEGEDHDEGERDDLWWEDLTDVDPMELEADIPCIDSETEELRLREADSDGSHHDHSFTYPEDWDDHWDQWDDHMHHEDSEVRTPLNNILHCKCRVHIQYVSPWEPLTTRIEPLLLSYSFPISDLDSYNRGVYN